MTDGYIKLWRKVLDGDMLKNHKLFIFWAWCLLKASYKQYKITVGFQEIELLPGQFIFGLKAASRETQLSIQNIRYCLRSLQGTQNLTIKTTNKFSILTIANWDLYQGNGIEINNQNNKQVTNKRQTSNNKQERKESKEEEYKSFVDENDFNTFWDLYPRKDAKIIAKEKYLKVAPDEKTRQQILDAVVYQTQTGKFNIELNEKGKMQYCPLASTWLNQKRFMDDIPTGFFPEDDNAES